MKVLSKSQEVKLNSAFKFKTHECGISLQKKTSISTLFTLIPDPYQNFWKKMPIKPSEQSERQVIQACKNIKKGKEAEPQTKTRKKRKWF